MKTDITSSAVPPIHSSSSGFVDTTTLQLLADWRAQDATQDPRELERAQAELAEFKKAMNEARSVSGEAPLYL